MGFIEHLQNVTTNNCDSLTYLRTPKITVSTEHKVFPSRCSVAAFSGKRSPYSGFLNRPWPQLQHLSTKSFTNRLHPTDWLTGAPNLSRTAQKTSILIVVQLLPWDHVCLQNRYSVRAVVYLHISRSLPSNESACHNSIKNSCIELHNVYGSYYTVNYLTVIPVSHLQRMSAWMVQILCPKIDRISY
jgi:hypothetical protein